MLCSTKEQRERWRNARTIFSTLLICIDYCLQLIVARNIQKYCARWLPRELLQMLLQRRKIEAYFPRYEGIAGVVVVVMIEYDNNPKRVLSDSVCVHIRIKLVLCTAAAVVYTHAELVTIHDCTARKPEWMGNHSNTSQVCYIYCSHRFALHMGWLRLSLVPPCYQVVYFATAREQQTNGKEGYS